MVKSIEELKNLIIWAKEQKLKSLKLADIHIEISDLALVESLNNQVNETSEQTDKSALEATTEQAKEEQDDLYWSTR
jgi:hypothetical protein